MLAPVARFSPGALSGGPEALPSGGVRVPMRVARTGPYVYRDAAGRSRVEYRGEAELKRIAGRLKDTPIVLTHPAARRVDADSWRQHAIGHVSDVQPELVRHDGELWIQASGVFSDGAAITGLQRGDYAELSLGCDMTEPTRPAPPGVNADAEQVGLVPNHLALLPPGQARAGRGARVLLDSGNEAHPLDVNQEPPQDTMSLSAIKPEDFTALANQAAELRAQVTTLTAERDTARSEAQAHKTKLDSVETELATAKGELVASKTKLDSVDPEKLAEELLAFREAIAPALPKGYDFKGKPAQQVRLDAATFIDPKTAYTAATSAEVLDAFIRASLNLRPAVDDTRADSKDQPKTPEQSRAERINAYKGGK